MSDTATPLADKHFTPENIATLTRAYEVLCQIGYEMGSYERYEANRDTAAITLADVTAGTLSKLLSVASIRYGLNFQYGAPEALGDASASRVTTP